MADFEFQGANGKKYAVQAPDLDTAVVAFEKIVESEAMQGSGSANRKAGFLPFLATDANDELTFDITAGLPGTLAKSVASGVTAPGDIMSGKLKETDPDYMNRLMDTGALMTGINPAVVSGQRGIPGTLNRLVPEKPKVPTAQELKTAGAAGFRKAEDMGVDYSTMSVKELVDDLARQLETKGIREKRAPDTFSIFDEINAGPDASVVSLTGLREIRAALNDIAGDFGASAKKTDRKAAQDAIRGLDQFLEEPPFKSAVAGAGVGNGGTALAAATPDAFAEAVQRLRGARDRAKEAGATIKEANANYAAGERSNTVAGKIEKAELDAAAAGSGLNLDNRTRQVLKAIIDPERPRNRRGFSKEELAVVDDIVRGKHGANLARWLSNYLGGGGGLGAAVPSGIGATAGAGLGLILGGPVGSAVGAGLGGALPPIAGRGLRGLSNRITAGQAKKLDELIRMRSPLYGQRAANPAMSAPYPATMDIINRALLLQAPRPEFEGLQRRTPPA